MNTIFELIQKERSHFERLSKNAQRLVVSYFLYGLGVSFLTTFVNAFIWKSSHDFVSVALYYIGVWLTIPIIFFVNGVLLQFVSISLLYSLGLMLTALAPFILILFAIKGYALIFGIGIVFGIGVGFNWANRNLFILRLTEDANRNYFFGLTFSIDTITGIFVPFLIGWLIVFGGAFSYQILAIVLFGIYLVAGISTLPLTMQPSEYAHGIVTHVKGKWNTMRLVSLLFGFQNGIYFILPSLIVLFLLGNEGILGTVTSLGALLSAFVIYQVGKVSLAHHRIYIFALGITILVITTIIFALYPSGLGIVTYVVGTVMTANFTFSSYNPIVMNLIDQYTPSKKQNRFKYIVDHEIFLNLGRITGIGIFFLLYYYFSRFFALRFTPIIIAAFQVAVVFLLSKVVEIKPAEKSS